MACEINNRDRLSALPDDILCHILSFIPTKYSVHASVLSTRWKNLYTLVPSLSFSILDFNRNANSFKTFVNKTLLRYNVTNMRKFYLRYLRSDKKDVCSWISHAICRNVREVHLTNGLKDSHIPLPANIYTSNTLVELRISGKFFFNFSDSMCLPSLKTLHLSGGVLLVGESEHLSFSTFPVLEDLSLELSDNGSKIFVDISVMSLKILELKVLSGKPNIVLNAPALEILDFNIQGRLKISGDVLNSLVRARIVADICYFWSSKDSYGIREITKMVSNVRNLDLSSGSMKALAFRDRKLPQNPNLVCLELSDIENFRWKLLPDLLESSPNLEILIFHHGLMCGYGVSIPRDFKMDSLLNCACLFLHLKELQIRSFTGIEPEFQTVKYFLKNAEGLKKIVLNFCNFYPASGIYVSERLQELQRYRRDCQIMVFQNDYLLKKIVCNGLNSTSSNFS